MIIDVAEHDDKRNMAEYDYSGLSNFLRAPDRVQVHADAARRARDRVALELQAVRSTRFQLCSKTL